MGILSVAGDQFTLDGRPFRILSGAIHYFRVPRAYWRDRLLKARACHLNTVETYIAWNRHQPEPGQFDFSGDLDVAAFVREAADVGLNVIIRPGPYICSEWDFGGLPWWLLSDPGMRLRCRYQPYLDAVDRWFDALLAQLVPLQSTHGGPIFAMQVENEYGSYGNDQGYLRYLQEGMRRRGVDVLLFTSDGPSDSMLQGGTLPDVLKVANFGSGSRGAFAKLREYQPRGPLMCGEFWNGWFDHWGAPHHERGAEDAAQALEEMLAAGASVNHYMLHGGTNFGFFNGANYMEQYEPDVTSYDYGAPLDEAGDPTPKYDAFREIHARYVTPSELPAPRPAPKQALGTVTLTEAAPLFPTLPTLTEPVRRTTPEPMEYLGQGYGFILYRTQVSGPRPKAALRLKEVRDRAQIFLDGKPVGVLDRENPAQTLEIAIPEGGASLDILVENMGRVNYGPEMIDRKGITEGVLLGNQFLFGWEIFCLPLNDLSRVPFQPTQAAVEGPCFYRGVFQAESQLDTFLALPGWKKGVCFLNGFNLGRYWERGPQQTLYVPGPLLKSGENELIVFELHAPEARNVEFRDRPTLG